MGKSLIKNSLFNFVYTFAEVCFPIVSSVYVSRILLAEGVGRVTYAQTIVTYFVNFAALGLPNYGVKALVAGRDSGEKTKKVFSELFTINLCSTVLSAVVYYMMIFLTGWFVSDMELFLLMGALLVSNIFNVEWLFRGIEDFKFMAVRSIFIKLATLIPLFVFVRDKSDFIAYAVIVTAVHVVTQLTNAVYIVKNIGFDFSSMNLKRHLMPALVLFASSVAIEIYALFDSTMLGIIHGNVSVGYYGNATKLIRMFFSLVTALVVTVYPRVTSYFTNGNKDAAEKLIDSALKMSMYITVPSMIGILIGADYIIPALFGDSFGGSVAPLRILSVLLIIFSVAYTKGHIVLMAAGREKSILKASIAGAVINFVLNLFLIPDYRQDGAAIASVIAETIVTCILLHESYQVIGRKGLPKGIAGNAVRLCSFILVTAVVKYLLNMTELSVILKLILLVLGSACCYLLLTYKQFRQLLTEIRRNDL